MDDENASCAYDSEEDTQVSLLDLPVEVCAECQFYFLHTSTHTREIVFAVIYLCYYFILLVAC